MEGRARQHSRTPPPPKPGEIPEMREAHRASWSQLQTLQHRHDIQFHKDVMASSPSYQLRHSLMHVNKVLGTLSALTEKRFHQESINEIALELAERRLPDLQAFVLKMATLAQIDLDELFNALPSVGKVPRETSVAEIDWLEQQLAHFELATAVLTRHRAMLIGRTDIPFEVLKDCPAALTMLQQIALSLADYFHVDLVRSYRDRLLNVEHQRLA